MSACISAAGEFDKHQPSQDDHFTCADCGVVDEAALRAEINALRALVADVAGAAWDDGNATGLDGWEGPNRGAREPDREAIDAREKAVYTATSHRSRRRGW